MTRVGLISDTHAYLDEKVLNFLKDCDVVWHCGDFGDVSVADTLESLFPIEAVFGNVDGYELRHRFPENRIFMCEGVKVLMTHIGGYPGRYEPKIYQLLLRNRPKLFVCGHSHIAKVMYDKTLNCLHINPGAAGQYGIHKVRTACRFVIDGEDIKDLELAEFERRLKSF